MTGYCNPLQLLTFGMSKTATALVIMIVVMIGRTVNAGAITGMTITATAAEDHPGVVETRATITVADIQAMT